MPGKPLIVALLLAGLASAHGVQAAELQLPPGATVLDPEIVWDTNNPHSFAISPDGKQIAYISKGALWVCRVDAGPARILAILPDTITAFLAEYAKEGEGQPADPRRRFQSYREFFGRSNQRQQYVFSVAWAPNQSGVFYTVRKNILSTLGVFAYHVMHAPLNGDAEEIALIEGSFGVPQENRTSIHVAPDRKHVVISGYVPLIWDVLAARPQVTPYDLLLPSSTSGHYLGIEIDTRQLVLVDDQFRIARRFNVSFPAERRVDFTWSAGERYAVCRTLDRRSSIDGEAFRIGLETGQKLPLGKSTIRDQFVFTGEGGELLHLRIISRAFQRDAKGEIATSITRYSSDDAKHIVFTTKPLRRPEPEQSGKRYPPMVAAPDGSLVAVAVKRSESQAPGAHYHLVDRAGRATPLAPVAPVNDASYTTPYYPLAFTEDGHRMIARTESALFSLPVSAATENKEVNDEAKGRRLNNFP